MRLPVLTVPGTCKKLSRDLELGKNCTNNSFLFFFCSVSDPDPLVRGTRYGSGPESFYHDAKIVRKNLDFYCFMTFYL
jgi:hypothetical protein